MGTQDPSRVNVMEGSSLLERARGKVAGRGIQGDERGFMKVLIGGLIGVLVVVLVFAALILPIQEGIWDATDVLNTSSPSAAALLALVVILLAVAVVVSIVAWVMYQWGD